MMKHSKTLNLAAIGILTFVVIILYHQREYARGIITEVLGQIQSKKVECQTDNNEELIGDKMFELESWALGLRNRSRKHYSQQGNVCLLFQSTLILLEKARMASSRLFLNISGQQTKSM